MSLARRTSKNVRFAEPGVFASRGITAGDAGLMSLARRTSKITNLS
jgi:hypothetical protein